MDEQRKHELSELVSAFGPSLQEWVKERRAELVNKLVAAENLETRGAIKELDYLLGLPERTRQEILLPLQQEDGLA